MSEALVSALVAAGARHAVVCPGSRSTPLALACAGNQALRTWSVVDERSAAYFALGLAKASGRPSLLVCTSGTAGANFFPAVIEASMGHVPLVVLTADRPWELHGFGAPQTIDQHGLFGRYPRFFCDVPAQSPVEHLRALAACAVSKATGAPRGVAHLNVAFREPLEPTGETAPLPTRTFVVSSPRLFPDDAALRRVASVVSRSERGVIVCGPREREDGFAAAVIKLGAALGYPVLAEATSQVRYGAEVVASYEGLLRHRGFAEENRPQVVLRFGGGLTSKTLQRWLDGSGAHTAVFSDEGALVDPHHAAAEIVVGDAAASCETLAGLVHRRKAGGERFARGEQIARGALEAAFARDDQLTEPRIAHELVRALPPEAKLFVSSSMPIRDLDAFAPSANGRLRVFANRGANGIDGIVSSALGVAAAGEGPTALFTGDLALLHDLGGLIVARRHRLSLTLVVVNNDGGGIFSFLPIAGFPEHFEELFGTPHGVDLAHIAALAGARFARPVSASELRRELLQSLEGGLHLIEVRTRRAENVEHHRALFEEVGRALEAASWR